MEAVVVFGKAVLEADGSLAQFAKYWNELLSLALLRAAATFFFLRSLLRRCF